MFTPTTESVQKQQTGDPVECNAKSIFFCLKLFIDDLRFDMITGFRTFANVTGYKRYNTTVRELEFILFISYLESSPDVVTAQDASPEHKSRVRGSQSQLTLAQATVTGVPDTLPQRRLLVVLRDLFICLFIAKLEYRWSGVVVGRDAAIQSRRVVSTEPSTIFALRPYALRPPIVSARCQHQQPTPQPEQGIVFFSIFDQILTDMTKKSRGFIVMGDFIIDVLDIDSPMTWRLADLLRSFGLNWAKEVLTL
ncbi:hypothetical protein J6590_023003 [Homalodisca vitripennis]|nr:hypothetical protein J6590_023003 [Homalodisca vitripennis]